MTMPSESESRRPLSIIVEDFDEIPVSPTASFSKSKSESDSDDSGLSSQVSPSSVDDNQSNFVNSLPSIQIRCERTDENRHINYSKCDSDNEYSSDDNLLSAQSRCHRSPSRTDVKFHNRRRGSPDASTDLARLKQQTLRLKLTTRRPSYVAWKQKYLETPKLLSNSDDSEGNDVLSDERRNKINSALEWIRFELQSMKVQDQDLARQFLSIKHDLNHLKLQRSCQEHAELIDDVRDDMEDVQELSEISDLPPDMYPSNPLRHIGLTKMHISSRRFSIL